MKKTAKTLATVLLASSAAKALESPLIVSGIELKNYEARKNILGLKERLLQFGLIVQTNKKDIFILNEVAMSNLTDEVAIKIMSGLIEWLTNDAVQVEQKDWKNMTPSTQDYKI